MGIMEVVAAVTGTIASVVAIATAVRMRQLSRPSVAIIGGIIHDSSYESKTKKLTLGFGVVSDDASHVIVPCTVLVRNVRDVPVNDVRVDIRYHRACLVDETVTINRSTNIATYIGKNVAAGRQLMVAGDMAQVTFCEPLIRIGESLVFTELLRLPARRVETLVGSESSFDSTGRYETLDEFRGATSIQVSVWSSNATPASAILPVFALSATDGDTLVELFKRIIDAAWDGRRPRPGLYRRARFKRRYTAVQDAELCIVSRALLAKEGAINVDDILGERGVVYFEMPPWGFFGPSFDVAEWAGLTFVKELPPKRASPTS